MEKPSNFGAAAVQTFATTPRPDDPYRYQTGWGNRFASEAVYVHPSTFGFVNETDKVFQSGCLA
jgi:hypothetical protein